MSASSNTLEASVPKFSAIKDGDVALLPSPLLKVKDRQTGICLLWVSRSCSHHQYICYSTMSSSSNALEASIPAFAVGKEGDVSSPSPLSNNKRLANRYLFAVGKPLLFASPVHLLCYNERFQRRAGSINRFVFSCKRGRRCLVALCATNKGKKCNQAVFSRVQSAQLRLPAA